MNKPLETGLKVIFVVQALSAFLTGALALFVPATIAALSGLKPEAVPALQQAGALSMGYVIGAIFAIRASNWDQVRIFVIASLVAFGLSLIGAFYYVVILGVVALGLVVIMIASLIATVGFAYYLYKYEMGARDAKQMSPPVAG